MQRGSLPTGSQRFAAGVSLLLIVVISVAAVVLAFMNLQSLLAAWFGMAIAILGFSAALKSSGSARAVFRGVTAVGIAVFAGSLVWLAVSSPWGLLALVVAVAIVGFLGSYALKQPVRVVDLLAPKHPVLFVNPKSGGGKAEKADLAAIAA